MGVHALYVYIENHFKLVHEMRGSYMMYTLDHYCCFNWYHWILSIGINFDFSCILIYVCMYVCSSISIVSISIGIKFFIHIYFVYAKAWVSTLFQLIQFSGINFDLSCILTYVCMYVCFSIPIVSISIGIKFFIHIYFVYAKLEL